MDKRRIPLNQIGQTVLAQDTQPRLHSFVEDTSQTARRSDETSIGVATVTLHQFKTGLGSPNDLVQADLGSRPCEFDSSSTTSSIVEEAQAAQSVNQDHQMPPGDAVVPGDLLNR